MCHTKTNKIVQFTELTLYANKQYVLCELLIIWLNLGVLPLQDRSNFGVSGSPSPPIHSRQLKAAG